MRIQSSRLDLSSSHRAQARSLRSESLRAWVGDRGPDFEGRARAGGGAVVVQVSDAARRAASAAPPAAKTEASAEERESDEVQGDPRLSLLKDVVERLTGREVKVVSSRELSGGAPDPELQKLVERRQAPNAERAGFGVEYDLHEVYEEHERTTASLSGVVHTADGQQIEVELHVVMQRDYRQETNVSIRKGDAVRKDPLVLNFDGDAAQLQDLAVDFDLDADGQRERMPLLGGGSAYLVLDRNGNGRVDDGRELFGATSGDGFAELARYDGDGNGFIDEGDAAFAQLRLWTPARSGNGSLATLAERDVGAIALTSVSTPFELRTADNRALGAVRATSLYLRESGGAGTVQQLDLNVLPDAGRLDTQG